MDLFLQGCQGLGLALAAGVAGAAPLAAWRVERRLAAVAAVLAAAAGALLLGASLAGADHPAWPGWPVGAAAAAFAFALTRSVVASAAGRLGGSSPAALPGMALAGGVALAGLSLVAQPVSLAALAAGAWLATSRRARARRKYEGLRVLR